MNLLSAHTRFAIVVLSIGAICIVHVTPIHAACCKCASSSGGASTICLTTDGTCATIQTDAKNEKLKDVSCESTALSDAQCKKIAEGGQCQEITAAMNYGAVATKEKTKIKGIVPNLNVKIPGLTFSSDVVSENGFIEIPYFAQYVSALYRYLLGIVVLAAAVMVVYGGFKYILGQTAESIQGGKEIIIDALIGLGLVLGAVAIFRTVNPSVTDPKSLRIAVVEPEGFLFGQAQMTTHAETVNGAPGSGAAASGSYVPPLTNCPFELTQPLILEEDLAKREVQKILREWKMVSLNIVQDRRAQEFFQKIQSVVAEKPLAERMSLIASAAVQCGIHLESCGNTAGTIWELAGIGDRGCFTDHKLGCNPHENYFGRKQAPKQKTAEIIQIPLHDQMLSFKKLLCINECGSDFQKLPDCISEKGKAIEAVRTEMLKRSGWPDRWADDLKPGDIIQVYTGNKSCGGGHSALFFGWASNGRAQVIQGQFGQKVTSGTLCIKKVCGKNMLPLLRIIKPKTGV